MEIGLISGCSDIDEAYPPDRRAAERVVLDQAASLQLAGARIEGRLGDISIAGALFLAVDMPPGLNGQPCRLVLDSCQGGASAHELNGLVMRASQQALGIRFKGLRQTDYELLKKMVLRHGGNVESLDRDFSALNPAIG